MKEFACCSKTNKHEQLSWGERVHDMRPERDGCLDRGLKPAKVQAKQNQLTHEE